MPAILVNDVPYFYESAGAGRPLLLLHGFTGSTVNWHPFVPPLASHYRVVVVDVLGHGRTASPPDEKRYTMQRVAADLITLLDELDIKQTALLGYSMGGRLALYTAVAYPERINLLMLESASPGLATAAERAERVERDRALADWIATNSIEAFVDRWQALPLWRSQAALPVAARKALRQQRLQNTQVGLANSLRGMGTGAQPSLWPSLSEVKTPVLLVAGELDEKFVTINQQMAALLPRAYLQIVAGVGHMVHLEQASQFGQIVLSFLT